MNQIKASVAGEWHADLNTVVETTVATPKYYVTKIDHEYGPQQALHIKGEQWLAVTSHPYRYAVSSLGRVVDRQTGELKKISRKGNGYLHVGLTDFRGVTTMHQIHRLVANAFHPNPYNLPTVDHYPDRSQLNNAASNLRWANQKTQWENSNQYKPARAILQISLSGEIVQRFESLMDAKRILGVDPGCVSRCATGQSKTHKGHRWAFESDYTQSIAA